MKKIKSKQSRSPRNWMNLIKFYNLQPNYFHQSHDVQCQSARSEYKVAVLKPVNQSKHQINDKSLLFFKKLNGKLYLQLPRAIKQSSRINHRVKSRTKFLKQCEQNWTGRENFEICFCVILTTSTKLLFMEGRMGTRLCLLPFCNFPNISLFSKILNLFLKTFKSLSNSWGNSYTFLELDIKYHFTCGKSNLYLNLEVFHNFMSAVVYSGNQRTG